MSADVLVGPVVRTDQVTLGVLVTEVARDAVEQYDQLRLRGIGALTWSCMALGISLGLLALLAQVGGMFIDDSVPVGAKKTATTSSLIITTQNLESTQSPQRGWIGMTTSDSMKPAEVGPVEYERPCTSWGLICLTA